VTVLTLAFAYPIAAYLADVLRELGFHSRVQVSERFFAIVHAAQISVEGWNADSPEPASFLRAVVACGNVNNASDFCDRGIDGAIARAEAAGPGAWQRIERRIAHAAPIVPLANERELAIASPRAGNLQFHPLEGLMLDRVWVR
jgi:ABC-type oligopeptide transport system substrate-binding subunit